jgi:hypothetical protein
MQQQMPIWLPCLLEALALQTLHPQAAMLQGRQLLLEARGVQQQVLLAAMQRVPQLLRVALQAMQLLLLLLLVLLQLLLLCGAGTSGRRARRHCSPTCAPRCPPPAWPSSCEGEAGGHYRV